MSLKFPTTTGTGGATPGFMGAAQTTPGTTTTAGTSGGFLTGGQTSTGGLGSLNIGGGMNKPSMFSTGGQTGGFGIGGTTGTSTTSTGGAFLSGQGGAGTSFSLIGPKPTIGGNTSTGTGMPSTQSAFSLPIQAPMQQQISQSNKKEYYMGEIINVIQNYLWVLNPGTEINMFKSMLYNRVPKGSENQIENLMTYTERKIGEDGENILIDRQLWNKALSNNPNSQLFYPCQISSPLQLFRRIKTTQFFEYSALELILQLQNTLTTLNNQYDNDIENHVSLIKKKLQIMKTKQLLVISKLEKLALMIGKAEKNYAMENIISTKLDSLKAVLTENNDYTIKIKELSSMISIIGSEIPVEEEKDYFKDFDNTRLEKNVNILADMKKIFDVTFNSLKQNLNTINIIRNDLEKLKKYGKITK